LNEFEGVILLITQLNGFFSLPFILASIIIFIIIWHLFLLHETRSKNQNRNRSKIGINRNLNKILFNVYFTLKDIFGFILFLIIFMFINLQYPFIFRDSDNFTEANLLVTPTHIQPEWYFLFAYAILRSIPNKLGGMIALLSSILILYTLKWIKYIKSNTFYPINQLIYWFFINNFILLTYIGRQVIELFSIHNYQTNSIN